MWKINADGNAYNPDTGERAFVVIGVVKEVDGQRYWVCDCNSEEKARHFVKSYADRLNAELNTEEINHVED